MKASRGKTGKFTYAAITLDSFAWNVAASDLLHTFCAILALEKAEPRSMIVVIRQ